MRSPGTPAVEILRVITDPSRWRQDATAAPPLGPSFEATLLQQADRLEVWGTTEDASDDYTEFRR